MGQMALGYGSEFHLLRMLGRRRSELNSEILEQLKTNGTIEWLDFVPDPGSYIPDREYRDVEFLSGSEAFDEIAEDFRLYWPTSRNTQNWDGVAKQGNMWILAEAKARIKEIESDCGASDLGSLELIGRAFEQTINAYNINASADVWKLRYYQKANRIAFLNFLEHHGVEAHLVFIYFMNGYDNGTSSESVKHKGEWEAAIEREDKYLGIFGNQVIASKISNVFIDVRSR